MSRPDLLDTIIPESICPKCGKPFYPAPYHVYKDSKHVYCSWTCFNHRNDGREYKYRYKGVIQMDLDGNELREFPSASAAAEFIGGQRFGIATACNNHTKYKKFLWKHKEET